MKAVSWVMMVLGMLFLTIGVWMLSEAYISTSWPKIEGQIVETKVAGRITQAGDAVKRHIEYYIKVTYAYEINNHQYRKSRYSMGNGEAIKGGFYDKSEARAWLKNSPWKVSKKIPVFVDPNDPENTVLSAGINWSTWIPVVMSGVFFLLAFLIKFLIVRQTAFQSSTDDYNSR